MLKNILDQKDYDLILKNLEEDKKEIRLIDINISNLHKEYKEGFWERCFHNTLNKFFKKVDFKFWEVKVIGGSFFKIENDFMARIELAEVLRNHKYRALLTLKNRLDSILKFYDPCPRLDKIGLLINSFLVYCDIEDASREDSYNKDMIKYNKLKKHYEDMADSLQKEKPLS